MWGVVIEIMHVKYLEYWLACKDWHIINSVVTILQNNIFPVDSNYMKQKYKIIH